MGGLAPTPHKETIMAKPSKPVPGPKYNPKPAHMFMPKEGRPSIKIGKGQPLQGPPSMTTAPKGKGTLVD